MWKNPLCKILNNEELRDSPKCCKLTCLEGNSFSSLRGDSRKVFNLALKRL